MDKPLLGMKAILSVPSYGPVDPARQKELRVAMMVAANQGLEWSGDASTDRMAYGFARNVAAEVILDGGKELADGVLYVDSDISLDSNDIYKLLNSARIYNVDFLTGIYYFRSGDPRPVLYDYSPKKKGFLQLATYPENAFFQADGCGFGITWVGYDTFKKVMEHKNFNKEKGKWFPDRRDVGGFGEDLSFCEMAMEVGAQLYVNSSVEVGHMGDPVVVRKQDYLKYAKELKEKKNATEREQDSESVPANT
jgi:glycosyltransferase involved in cell wall biosynthesis